MTLIDELKASISEMDDNELFDRLREIRSARRQRKAAPASKGKAKNSMQKISALLEGMSPDEIQALMKELEES